MHSSYLEFFISLSARVYMLQVPGGQRAGVCCDHPNNDRKNAGSKTDHTSNTLLLTKTKSRSGWSVKILRYKTPYLDGLRAFTARAMMSTYTEVGVPC